MGNVRIIGHGGFELRLGHIAAGNEVAIEIPNQVAEDNVHQR